MNDPNSDGSFYFLEEDLGLTTSPIGGGAFAQLPIEFPIGDPFILDMSITAQDLLSGTITSSNFGDLATAIQDRIDDLGNIGDNLLALVGGWEGAFDLLTEAMRGDVLGVPLPFIGDALADEADFLAEIKNSVLDNIAGLADQRVLFARRNGLSNE